jgi:hypothetical protein
MKNLRRRTLRLRAIKNSGPTDLLRKTRVESFAHLRTSPAENLNNNLTSGVTKPAASMKNSLRRTLARHPDEKPSVTPTKCSKYRGEDFEHFGTLPNHVATENTQTFENY